MLFNAEVAVLFRPDRIEIRSKNPLPEMSTPPAVGLLGVQTKDQMEQPRE
jgi:hypothetical protein